MTWKEWFDDKSQVIFGVTLIGLCCLWLAIIILTNQVSLEPETKIKIVDSALNLVGNIVAGLLGIGIGRATNNKPSNPEQP